MRIVFSYIRHPNRFSPTPQFQKSNVPSLFTGAHLAGTLNTDCLLERRILSTLYVVEWSGCTCCLPRPVVIARTWIGLFPAFRFDSKAARVCSLQCIFLYNMFSFPSESLDTGERLCSAQTPSLNPHSPFDSRAYVYFRRAQKSS